MRWNGNIGTGCAGLIVLMCLGISSAGAQPIEVSGTIASDTTWGPDLTYKVTGDLTVTAGVTLTILSGCSVEFSSESSDLIVNGRLDVQGSAASPVTFREFTGTPRWGGIYINATGTAGDSSLNYAVLENGGSNYFSATADSMLWIKDASPTLQHCTFQGSHYDAVHLEHSEATISDCLFANNGDDAVEMDLNSSPHWSGNSASGNALDGIRVLYGNLRKNRIWRVSALPYVLEPDITIDASYELTIEPGTMIQGHSSAADLIVQGTLTALGTEAQPIVFTSLADSDATVWGGIYFGPSAGGSRLEYCEVRYGGSNYFSSTANSMVRCQGSSPALVHCTLARSKLYGLSLLSSEATLEQVHFADNTYAAGDMDTASFPTFTAISATGNEYDAIEINGGSVSTSGRWDYCEIPYLIQGDVTVAEGVTLLINPDTEIQFKASSADLIVRGTLLALGEAATPIRFTSARRAATPGAWGGLVFSGAGSNASQLQNCEISYGGSNYFSEAGVSSLRIQNASPSISDCQISSSLSDGINLYGSYATIERCLLSGCAGHAIRMDVASFPSFDANEATGNGYNVITIRPGTLSQSGRWDLADLAYNLEGDVVVPQGVHLAIDAGNVIRFQSNSADLVIQGSLEALGTTTANILFTSLSTRSPGAFGGLYFGPTADSARTRLSYCVFEYGGSNYFSWAQGAMVYSEGCSPSLSNCSFENSRSDGLWIRGGQPTLTQTAFRNNGGDAIEIFSNTFPQLNGVTATGNGANAVRITGDQWTETGQWVRAGIPYRIGSDVVIQASGEVEIEAGTTLEFESASADLYVAGRLDCVGSSAQPIRFTSSRSSPARGSWGALTFAGGGKG
ncbi:MAG TPA: right-handed parallel beta-helix repeat-containing protein, partial [Firmicutes bacterium]|nr:right-handed parallel beta-helix repeat-containing protein [Bacillota bacterium]